MANGRILLPGRIETLKAVSEHYPGASPDALALAALMVRPFEPMVLSGAASRGHLRSNAKAIDLASHLKPEHVEELMGALAQDPEVYWKERSVLPWN